MTATGRPLRYAPKPQGFGVPIPTIRTISRWAPCGHQYTTKNRNIPEMPCISRISRDDDLSTTNYSILYRLLLPLELSEIYVWNARCRWKKKSMFWSQSHTLLPCQRIHFFFSLYCLGSFIASIQVTLWQSGLNGATKRPMPYACALTGQNDIILRKRNIFMVHVW